MELHRKDRLKDEVRIESSFNKGINLWRSNKTKEKGFKFLSVVNRRELPGNLWRPYRGQRFY